MSTEEDKTKRLGSAPVGPLFLKLAAPAVLGQMVMMLNNIIDRVWVGHIPGDGMLSLGAVGLSVPIQHLFLSVILMIASGMAPVVSILLGQGRRDEAAETSGGCIGLSVAVSVLSFAAIATFADGLLLTFGAGEESLPFARSYMRTIAWGLPFGNLLLVLTMWLNAQGYVSEGVKLNILSVVVNAVLDPVFIFGLGLGVTGAALATNAGMIVAFLCVCRLIRRNGKLLRFGFGTLVPRAATCRKPLLLGLSTMLNVALESLAMLFLNAGLQQYGGDRAVATMALYSVPSFVLMSLCMGLSMGAQPIISYNYGSGDLGRVRLVNNRFILSSFLCSLAFWGALMAWPRIWGCFTADGELVDYAAAHARLFFAVILVSGIQYAHLFIIKFLGLVKMSLVLGVLKRLGLLLPLIFILPAALPSDKVRAVLLASPLSEGIAFLVTSVCYLHVMRKLTAGSRKAVNYGHRICAIED